MNSQISIWGFYGVQQEVYSSYSVEEKSKMFREYHSKLLQKYHDSGKKLLFFCLIWFGPCAECSDLFSDKNSPAYFLAFAF